MRPLPGKVVLRREGSEEKKHGDLYIPESAVEKKSTATVVAISTADRHLISVDARVLIGKYAGVEFKHEEQDYLLVNLDDIQVIL